MQKSNSEEQQIWKKGLHLLSIREHSYQELFSKLCAKGFQPDQIENVLQDFFTEGWLNDQRFAENFARSRINKGFGPLKIVMELRNKGIENFAMQTVLDDMGLTWMDVLQQCYMKKYDDFSILSRKEWAKRMRFLQQRGFDNGLIQRFFNESQIKFDYSNG